MMKRFQCWAFLIVLAGMLNACGDKEKEQKEEGVQSVQPASTQTEQASVPNISVCDTYISQMKACVDSKISGPEKEQLNTSLAYLQKQIAESADKEQIAQQCQRNLDSIQEQKKSLGCL